jgi:hypothetical protein
MKGECLYKISKLMGNSPEICRTHYAALVPETMHDTVEFAVKDYLISPLTFNSARGTIRPVA